MVATVANATSDKSHKSQNNLRRDLWGQSLLFAGVVIAFTATELACAGSLYFTNPAGSIDTVNRVEVDGSGLEPLVLPDGGITTDPRGIAVDPAGHLYFARSGRIDKSDLDGDGAAGLTSSIGLAADVEVDPVGGKVYWTVTSVPSASQGIYRANLDGTDPEAVLVQSDLDPLYAGGLDEDLRAEGINSLELDLDAGLIYWTHTDISRGFLFASAGVNSVSLDGSSPTRLFDFADFTISFDDDTADADHFDLDRDEGMIYWVADNENLFRSKLDGTGRELLLSDGDAVDFAVALDADKDLLYFSGTSTIGSEINTLAADGSGIATPIVTFPGSISDIELGPRHAVPEPSAMWLLAIAVAVALGCRVGVGKSRA